MENILKGFAGSVALAVAIVIAANALGSDAVGGGMSTISPAVFHSSVAQKAPVISIAATDVYSTTTLDAADSGTLYSNSASGTTIILPDVNHTGAWFSFVVGGALDSGNLVIQSAEGDNIEGSLIVAGAVVTCDAADQVNFVTDGENIGDNLTLISDGTTWHVLDSNTLTSAKMTCTG